MRYPVWRRKIAMLLFYVGSARYVIRSSYILQIIPHVLLKEKPSSWHALEGLLDYHGQLVPVIDFCQLIEKRSAREAFHSRIILITPSEKKRERKPCK